MIDHVTLIHTKNIRMIEFYNIDFQLSFTLISETKGSFDKYILCFDLVRMGTRFGPGGHYLVHPGIFLMLKTKSNAHFLFK